MIWAFLFIGLAGINIGFILCCIFSSYGKKIDKEQSEQTKTIEKYKPTNTEKLILKDINFLNSFNGEINNEEGA